jgi:hypothetical protein
LTAFYHFYLYLIPYNKTYLKVAILGSILKQTIGLTKRLPKNKNGVKQQEAVLRKILSKAQFTAFGQHYQFSQLLNSENVIEAFQSKVPTHDYNSMFKDWWYRTLNGESYVTWPGSIKYFALSSGTSEASSKHIPVTKDMLKHIRKSSIKQIMSLGQYKQLSKEFFEKGILMVGGSTHLNYNGTYYEGDLSGITTGNIPFWFQHFYKPGRTISAYKDWDTKLDEMTKNAANWDIGVICGVPAWIQILMEKVIAYNNAKTIHDVWPNFRIYVGGGVAFAPYKKSFDALMGREDMIYLDTYLASEGFVAYQNRPLPDNAMKMVLNEGIFFEFVPFNEDHFDSEGAMKANVLALSLDEVEEGKEYALLLSTCSGAWRYLIGDTIKFTSLENYEIIITGRTKHFLSLCGEHLSVDNMNKALKLATDEMGLVINEYTVCGERYQNLFAHQWYVACDQTFDEEELKQRLDNHLKIINDDYRVERTAALKEIFVKRLPSNYFIEFLEAKGKVTAQSKFPRVMKGKNLSVWKEFLESKKI